MSTAREVLLDVTRLVARGWVNRPSNGIDRVAYAYLAHFGSRARAVVQYRGTIRTLTPHHSAALVGLLQPGTAAGFRSRLAALAPPALLAASNRTIAPGALYLNVSHTDLDLPAQWDWIRLHGLRAICMIHDLIPIRHPEFCLPRAVARHTERVVRTLAGASGIIANSRTTADCLASFAADRGIASPPVLATLIAGAGFLDRSDAAQGPAMPDPPRNGYFLCVSTIEPRKNHALLLDIWQRFAAAMGDAVPQLVLVGKWGALSDPVRWLIKSDALLQRQVRVLNDVTDAQLAPMMAQAIAVLQPSFAEGFGLPVCEALTMGTPVLASDLSSHREIAQGLATLLDPRDRAGWERAIEQLIRAPVLPAARQAAARAYVAPNWEEHFRRLDGWLGELASARSLRPAADLSFR